MRMGVPGIRRIVLMLTPLPEPGQSACALWQWVSLNFLASLDNFQTLRPAFGGTQGDEFPSC
jgi:hypothetical protein